MRRQRHPRSRFSKPCAILLLSTLLAACFGSGRAPRHSYYTLPTPPPRKVAGPTLKVEEFEAAPAYDHLRIVYRVSPYELRHYALREWVTKPGRLVAQSLGAFLEAKGAARLVGDAGEPQYVLQGRVEAIEERDFGPKPGRWYAVLDLRLRLLRTRDGAVVWQTRFRREVPTRRKNLPSVVARLTQLVAEAADQVARALSRVSP